MNNNGSIEVHVIATNKQWAPRCQGHAPDDHIEVYCYSVAPDENQKQIISALIDEINEEYQKDLNNRTEKWKKNNPNQYECQCEGEEFIGMMWVTHHSYVPSHNFSMCDPTYEDPELVIQKLKSLKQRMLEPQCGLKSLKNQK